MAKREAFPRTSRVRRRPDYLRIQGTGKRLSTPHFLVFVLRRVGATSHEGPSDSRLVSTARFGITVSRKVGSAVTRNRIKRWVREWCRREASRVDPSSDVVVVAKPQAASLAFDQARDELASVWARLSSGAGRSPGPSPRRGS